MVLLIDANILLDVLQDRREFVRDSALIWKLCETEQMKGYISVLSFANMMYIMRKELTPDKIEDVFRKLKLIFKFADFSTAVLDRAVAMNWKDFEDAVQYTVAETNGVDFIITRNPHDFEEDEIPALTPEQFLNAPHD